MDTENLDPMDDAVARALDGRRAERRVPVTELAERAGLNLRSVHRYLNGERAIPVSKFFALCLALGVEPGEVVETALNIFKAAEQERRG